MRNAEAKFNKLMEGCQYGEEETRDAAYWFIQGYKAAVPEKRIAPGRQDFLDQDEEIASKAYDKGWNDCRTEALK